MTAPNVLVITGTGAGAELSQLSAMNIIAALGHEFRNIECSKDDEDIRKVASRLSPCVAILASPLTPGRIQTLLQMLEATGCPYVGTPSYSLVYQRTAVDIRDALIATGLPVADDFPIDRGDDPGIDDPHKSSDRLGKRELFLVMLEASGLPSPFPIVEFIESRSHDGRLRMYCADDSLLVCPADLPKELATRAHMLVSTLNLICQLAGIFYVEFLCDSGQLEIAKLYVRPILANRSIAVRAAGVGGYTFSDLLSHLVREAASRIDGCRGVKEKNCGPLGAN
jgi:hypothetical protein